MACLPPIPARPADRPETLEEYHRRRAIVIMHRRLNDDLFGLLASPAYKVQAAMERAGWLSVDERLFLGSHRRCWAFLSLPIAPGIFNTTG
jgi:hypothetical protein